MVVTVALRVTKTAVRCLTVSPVVLQAPTQGRRSPTAARNINGDDPQRIPQGPAPHLERHWITQAYCHLQEVADTGIRVPILFFTWDMWALGLLKVAGEDSVITCLRGQLLRLLTHVILTSSQAGECPALASAELLPAALPPRALKLSDFLFMATIPSEVSFKTRGITYTCKADSQCEAAI